MMAAFKPTFLKLCLWLSGVPPREGLSLPDDSRPFMVPEVDIRVFHDRYLQRYCIVLPLCHSVELSILLRELGNSCEVKQAHPL